MSLLALWDYFIQQILHIWGHWLTCQKYSEALGGRGFGHCLQKVFSAITDGAVQKVTHKTSCFHSIVFGFVWDFKRQHEQTCPNKNYFVWAIEMLNIFNKIFYKNYAYWRFLDWITNTSFCSNVFLISCFFTCSVNLWIVFFFFELLKMWMFRSSKIPC